jgi:hypothetical protein
VEATEVDGSEGRRCGLGNHVREGENDSQGRSSPRFTRQVSIKRDHVYVLN